MLNISKISKMLLVSGLVLAFSCVAFNPNYAYAADDCKTARKALEDKEKELNDATKKLESARKDMNNATKKCINKGTALENCDEYKTAKGKVTTAEDELNKAENPQDGKTIQKLRAEASTACAGKSDANNYEGGGKEAEQAMNNAEANKDQAYARMMEACAGKGSNTPECRNAEAFYDSAVQEYEAAQEEYDSYYNQKSEEKDNYDKAKTDLDTAKENTEKAEKDMQKACAGGMNTEACMDAQYKYKEAQDKEKKAQDEYDDAEKDYNKEKRKAEKAVKEANEDIEKFCTPGSRRYNEKKCEEAKDAKDKAENNPIYKDNHPDKPKNGNSSENDEKPEVVIESVDDALNNNVTEADLRNLETEVLKKEAELSAAAQERSRLEQEKNIACAKPKSKECREANAAYEQAKLAEERAQAEYNKAQSEYTNAKETKDAVDKYMDENCNSSSSAECIKAQQDRYQKELDDAKNKLEDAKEREAKAQAELTAANAAYNKALAEQTEACKKPKSKACKRATEALEEALARKNKAEEDLAIAKEDVAAFEKIVEDSEKSLDEWNKKADEAAAEEAKRAEEEAKAERKKKAEEICARYGDESVQCKTANERIENPEHRGYIRVINQGEEVAELGFNYTKSDDADVFEMVTRRAAYIIISIKPIVYIFAGFGLIAFAWGAIFNKISWRHFANISIGLFLVANAGRLIEYMVTNGDGDNYYIGQWKDSVNKEKKNELSAALGDTYYTYSYVEKDLQKEWDDKYGNKNKQTEGDTPTKDNDESADPSDVVEKATEGVTDKDKFCQSGLGLGNGGFKECIKDVVGAVKHVTDSIQTTIATVQHVQNRVEDIKNAKEGLQNAFDQMKNGDIFGGLGGILNNIGKIDTAANSAGSAVDQGFNNVWDNMSNIGDSSNVQSDNLLNILQIGVGSADGATDSWNNYFNGGGGSSGGGQ